MSLYCKDCKHLWDDMSKDCEHPQLMEVNMVSGPQRANAHSLRSPGGRCGLEGKFFEPKPSLVRRWFRRGAAQ